MRRENKDSITVYSRPLNPTVECLFALPSFEPPQQKELLDRICEKLRQSESETLRIAFLEYTKSISLITDKCSRKNLEKNGLFLLKFLFLINCHVLAVDWYMWGADLV